MTPRRFLPRLLHTAISHINRAWRANIVSAFQVFRFPGFQIVSAFPVSPFPGFQILSAFRFPPSALIPALLLCSLALLAPSARAAWQNELTPPKSGGFPPPPEMKLHYHFGWSALSAATADFNFSRPRPDLLQIEAQGATTGVVRGLWKLDASYVGTVNAITLRPLEFNQLEKYRSDTKHTEASFTNTEVWRRRYTTPTDPVVPKKKRFSFPYLNDLDSAFFLIRSQRLANGDTYKFVVFPQTTAYLATVTVTGRSPLSIKAGKFQAISCDLKLQEVNKNQELVPHQKFKKATLWVSDDASRIPLKVESEIFVGSVWLELEKAEIKK
jgi:hypothetical protein